MVRKGVIIGSVVAGLVVAAGLATLIWWLVTRGEDAEIDGDGDVAVPPYETILLEGEGIGDLEQRAAFTRITGSGDMFWWFYPKVVQEEEPEGPEGRAAQATRPLLLWLDGVSGLPPSLLANFGMFGPFDFNLERRNDSWVDEYNLLFVDAPLGAGFSTILDSSEIPVNPSKNAEHLILTLESFYNHNKDYENTPLYIFGQGYGAQLALSLALGLKENEKVTPNLKGVILGNPVVSPALALTQLGFYLEELGYIDDRGRAAVEILANTTNTLVQGGMLAVAFDYFLSFGEFVNEVAGAIAVNLHRIIDKLENTATTARDIFGQRSYLEDVVGLNLDLERFMNDTVASALGITNPNFDIHQEDILQAFRQSFMTPAEDQVERILNETDITVTIYNGNLDAVSNTPGQLKWVHNLRWDGQEEFLDKPRQTLIVNGLVEGYFQETDRLKFYWINAAGLSVPLDSPVAMRRILQRITGD